MKLSWGWKIAMLYGGFVVMMISLVVLSSQQKIDLVSKDYYKEEIAYQNVLDASKNQANLTGTLTIRANEQEVTIDFPNDHNNKQLTGNVNFYAAENKDWDKNFRINTSANKLVIPREQLRKIRYTLRVSYMANGKSFYYETQVNLRA